MKVIAPVSGSIAMLKNVRSWVGCERNLTLPLDLLPSQVPKHFKNGSNPILLI